jgi:cyclopropane-fatty-acyl-phospholipid synthase
MFGEIETPDLGALLQVLVDNRDEVDDVLLSRVASFAVREFDKIWFWWRQPSGQTIAKKNIAEHYDLTGLFSHFLDATMTYSSGVFRNPTDSLEQSQRNKISDAVEALRLKPGMRVLEIGCG